MRRIFVLGVFVMWTVVLACNKGLHPVEPPSTPALDLSFPIEVYGGNPCGVWVPALQNPLEVHLVNPDQFGNVRFELLSQVSGQFVFDERDTFKIQSTIKITPQVYIWGNPVKFPPFEDTFNDSGLYEQPQGNVLILPLKNHTFQLDTLGYTVAGDSLILINLPHAFDYMGMKIEYYMIFHLVRSSSSGLVRDRFISPTIGSRFRLKCCDMQ